MGILMLIILILFPFKKEDITIQLQGVLRWKY